MTTAEVVIREVQGDGGFQVCQFLAERVRQSPIKISILLGRIQGEE
jgi:hypothetical protein